MKQLFSSRGSEENDSVEGREGKLGKEGSGSNKLLSNRHPSKVVPPFLLAAAGYSALIALEAAALLIAIR